MKLYVIYERESQLFYRRIHGFNFEFVEDAEEATTFEWDYDLLNTLDTLQTLGANVVERVYVPVCAN